MHFLPLPPFLLLLLSLFAWPTQAAVYQQNANHDQWATAAAPDGVAPIPGAAEPQEAADPSSGAGRLGGPLRGGVNARPAAAPACRGRGRCPYSRSHHRRCCSPKIKSVRGFGRKNEKKRFFRKLLQTKSRHLCLVPFIFKPRYGCVQIIIN